jgi:hypothetical protein
MMPADMLEEMETLQNEMRLMQVLLEAFLVNEVYRPFMRDTLPRVYEDILSSAFGIQRTLFGGYS